MTEPAPLPPADPAGLPPGYQIKPAWERTPVQAAAQLRAPDHLRPLLLDCRRDEEFAFNRIEGALHIPMSQIEQRLDELHEALGDAQGARDVARDGREVLVYCHHGVRSLRVAATLRAHGFARAYSVAGGIEAWSLGVDAGIPRY